MHLVNQTYDPATGITEQYWHNPLEGTVTIRKLQDVQKVIDNNKEEFNSFNKGYSDSRGTHKIATIPMVVIDKWRAEDGFDWFKATSNERKRWLEKPENAVFKTRPGKLI